MWDAWNSLICGRPPSLNINYTDCRFPEDRSDVRNAKGEREMGCKSARLTKSDESLSDQTLDDSRCIQVPLRSLHSRARPQSCVRCAPNGLLRSPRVGHPASKASSSVLVASAYPGQGRTCRRKGLERELNSSHATVQHGLHARIKSVQIPDISFQSLSTLR